MAIAVAGLDEPVEQHVPLRLSHLVDRSFVDAGITRSIGRCDQVEDLRTDRLSDLVAHLLRSIDFAFKTLEGLQSADSTLPRIDVERRPERFSHEGAVLVR